MSKTKGIPEITLCPKLMAEVRANQMGSSKNIFMKNPKKTIQIYCRSRLEMERK